MQLNAEDYAAIWLTLKLAGVTTVLLMLLCTPLAWWLAHTRSRWRGPIGAVVALPLVLPPTVIGFYLLVTMGPNGPVGKLTQAMGLGNLPFTFAGLVVGSLIYSMPFTVQPLQRAFEALGPRPMEAAASLGASPLDRFLTVALPLARPGFITAAVLMLGGNIPGVTRVVSVQIYDHVEAMEYGHAHMLAAGMVVFSFIVLLALNWLQPKAERRA